MTTHRKKRRASSTWATYWLLGRRPFEDARWLLRWIRLKEELRLKLGR